MPRGVPKAGFRKTKKFREKNAPTKVILSKKKPKIEDVVSNVTTKKNTTPGPFVLLDYRGKRNDIVATWDKFPTNAEVISAWENHSKLKSSKPFFMVCSVMQPIR